MTFLLVTIPAVPPQCQLWVPIAPALLTHLEGCSFRPVLCSPAAQRGQQRSITDPLPFPRGRDSCAVLA